MSSKATNELNQIMKSINTGHFTRSDIALLLVTLRFTTNNKTIKDLANFIAHPEGRDQGAAHASVQKWVDQFIQLAESSGGSIRGPSPVFNRKNVTNELLRSLKAAGVSYSESLIRTHSKQIISHIKSLIVECDFVLNDKRITRCWISRSSSNALLFKFQVKGLNPGVISISEGGTIAAPLFE